MSRMRLLLPTAVLLVLSACQASRVALPDGRIQGTWGGDDAGVIADDTTMHVHIGCESGYTDAPVQVDADGRFSAVGQFTVGAYPIGPGTTYRAVFSGRVHWGVLTLTVQLADTARQFGPVSVVYGREPRMGPCPICATANRPAARRMLSSGPHVYAGHPESHRGPGARRAGP